MLKRLELVGFKSFADKTQFDFANGVTAIVGPNGSGKSNVVDAVRWILGEQSAKSLRGGEMADVIFNGSATRRSFGMAEVTMTFDNSRRQLATEAEEVQITRRVYRSGEGEYLINQQLCRLKDIKDLFLGSGAGSNAYCIIEQGRVDSLLQASTRDRRFIFEEAAGISRFKARKIETARKLEKVDLNLQRLRDIIDEVEKQLRSVKLQASKAQRYQEYSGKLQELRVAVSLQQYHQWSEQLRAALEVLDLLRARLNECSAETRAAEAEMQRLDAVLAGLDESVREQEARHAQARQQIAAEKTTLHREWELSTDLDADLARGRGRLTELNAKVGGLAETAAVAGKECAAVESQCQEQRQRVQTLEADLRAATDRLGVLQQQVQADKAEHLDQMRQAAHLQNDAVSYKAQVDNLRREHERLRLKGAQAAEHLASIDVELQELTEADESLQTRLGKARQTHAEQIAERERARHLAEAAVTLAADLRAQRSGLASRVEVLDGLERTHEGLGAGVREVYSLLDDKVPNPESSILDVGLWTRDLIFGTIADFLHVRREHAPLIDLALGETAQRFLVRDAERLHEALRRRSQPFAGRVSFSPARSTERGTRNDLAIFDHLHVTFPDAWLLMSVVRCAQPELAELPEELLGNAIVVIDLAAAREMQMVEWRLRSELPNTARAYRYVTLQGELLEADGTVTVGTQRAEMGILSRKSELRELREQAAGVDARIAESEGDVALLRERAAGLDVQAGALKEEIDVLAEQAADLRSRITQHRERRAGLHEEVALSHSEMSGLQQEIAGLEAAWHAARAQAEAAEQKVQGLQTRLEQADRETREKEQQRQHRQHECMAAEVALAKVEERFAAVQARLRQVENDLAQRLQERQQGERHLAETRSRQQESQRVMLQASATLAVCYLEKEAAEREAARGGGERERHRLERQRLAENLQTAQTDRQQQQQQAHAHELQANDLRHRRDSLADRLREDYQLELAELYAQALASSQPLPEAPPDAEPQIAELRGKLSRLGSVNLDALQELAELEVRAAALQAQFDDLTAAQRSLQEIIAKINQDSRKLFAEAFATIRTHFQELFRKLFGGGMADVVLEDENDILESGIEIVARPPGKELRSISLMSGGEKTMTAVALLLAIFRSKPSPFCILDEVDAALDEANIGRFTAVLREFLDRSQFILVTHSKKTMGCADVLYGITMQESGISKRVAVRFEDWPDDGPPPENSGATSEGQAGALTATEDFGGK